jgi:hypothetical protein
MVEAREEVKGSDHIGVHYAVIPLDKILSNSIV